jgi:mannose-6-phosphate isomerase-like protein (cupin superfamily)
MVRRSEGGYTWEGVDVLPYKEDGTVFKSVTRQTLFQGEGNLPVEFRYFEVGTGGHSTLERHEHQHAVMVIRGSGRVLVGGEISEIGTHDIVHIPAMTWHQFRATNGEPLGFLCIVSCERDRPQRPGAEELESICGSAEVAKFIRF